MVEFRTTGRSPMLVTEIACAAGGVPASCMLNVAVDGLSESCPIVEKWAVTCRLCVIGTTHVGLVVHENPVPVPIQFSKWKIPSDVNWGVASSVTELPST